MKNLTWRTEYKSPRYTFFHEDEQIAYECAPKHYKF